jgi:hypothetical protein
VGVCISKRPPHSGGSDCSCRDIEDAQPFEVWDGRNCQSLWLAAARRRMASARTMSGEEPGVTREAPLRPYLPAHAWVSQLLLPGALVVWNFLGAWRHAVTAPH